MDLTADHQIIESAQATRRYFAKFERIIGHLHEVTKLTRREGLISEREGDILSHYLDGMGHSFSALSYKYLMANRVSDQSHKLLSIDKLDSGFPVYQEILQMANDALQASHHLRELPTTDRLKQEMVSHILSERSHPTHLQYALSQRLYYENLSEKDLFLARNHPQILWSGDDTRQKRRSFLVYWATYDSQTNIPSVYMMALEDTGRRPLPKDQRRWPRVQAHLMAQSLSSLNLLTIAKGLDEDFDHLHPKIIRRFTLGPMFSHAFTKQGGAMRDMLAQADAPAGFDWALTWTTETLVSDSVRAEKSGFFGKVEREIFKLDKSDPSMSERGLTHLQRSIILPLIAYQTLKEKHEAAFDGIRKYVVGDSGKILSYR